MGPLVEDLGRLPIHPVGRLLMLGRKTLAGLCSSSRTLNSDESQSQILRPLAGKKKISTMVCESQSLDGNKDHGGLTGLPKRWGCLMKSLKRGRVNSPTRFSQAAERRGNRRVTCWRHSSRDLNSAHSIACYRRDTASVVGINHIRGLFNSICYGLCAGQSTPKVLSPPTGPLPTLPVEY